MLAGLAFPFPVAIYFLILANLNRRSHPVMVPGPWDFSEVLLACSGILIFGGPVVITGFNERWRQWWLYANKRQLATATGDFWTFWLSVLGLYFLVLLAAAIYLLWRRRLATAIYNIELPTLQDYISLTLDRLGLDWQQIDQRYFISGGNEVKEIGKMAEVGIQVSPTPRLAESGPKLMLELDAFPSLRHVTLYWSSDHELRDDIEAELARALAEVHCERNRIAKWMIGVTIALFGVMVATVGLIFLLWGRRF
jgi:LPXTG-motif cell wall-anchored protein